DLDALRVQLVDRHAGAVLVVLAQVRDLAAGRADVADLDDLLRPGGAGQREGGRPDDHVQLDVHAGTSESCRHRKVKTRNHTPRTGAGPSAQPLDAGSAAGPIAVNATSAPPAYRVCLRSASSGARGVMDDREAARAVVAPAQAARVLVVGIGRDDL